MVVETGTTLPREARRLNSAKLGVTTMWKVSQGRSGTTHQSVDSEAPKSMELPEQECQLVGGLIDLLAERTAARVARLGIVIEQDRAIGTVGPLQQSRHLARVQWVDAGVAVAANQKHRWIPGAFLHMLIRRVGIQVLKLLGVLGRTIFRHPKAPHQELLVTQHVQQRVAAHDRPEKIGALSERRTNQQAAVRGPEDTQLGRLGVLVGNQPLGRGNEVIENTLLSVPHARLVPFFSELAPAAQVGQREDAAVLRPHNGLGGETGSHTDVEATVTSHQARIRAVELEPLLVHQEHRNFDLVLRLVPDLLDLELAGVDGRLSARPNLLPAARHVVAVDGRWNVEGAESEEGLFVFPAAAYSRHAAERRKLEVAAVAANGIENPEARTRVTGVIDDDLAARQAEVRDRRVAFGNDLTPALALRMIEVDRENPAVR